LIELVPMSIPTRFFPSPIAFSRLLYEKETRAQMVALSVVERQETHPEFVRRGWGTGAPRGFWGFRRSRVKANELRLSV
jgi:hypothetical protein